uniref:Putative cytosolic Fe-S cluster assembly factor AAEL012261 n=1 Tax=Lygus hesperus TaxID=30085 RepID=A0A146M033_LYGHE
MASRFSGAVQIANLDDFITPSQECIKPVEIKKDKSRTGSKIRIEEDGSYVDVSGGVPEKLARVDITLADCLACSGCITTAETVLITQQSHEEMLRVFRNKEAENKQLVVVSLSLQPILSLAEALKLPPEICLDKLCGLLKRLGADMVVDMGIAEDLALIEEYKEFSSRYQKFLNGDKNALPMLASTCPGWVCYAEKTKGHLLPNLSSCRSPQQIMGRLLKGYVSSQLSPSHIYHVTLMPCYDKKLEASRSQFSIDDVRDVDCVVTPVEIVALIKEVCGEGGLPTEDDGDLDWPWDGIEKCQPLTRHDGSGSGGYAQRILSLTARDLEIERVPKFENVNRKIDMQVSHISEKDQNLKIAVVTGFRNIQNLVNKMKRGTCDYQYVEIMACPTGCLNGGAQVKGQLKEVEKVFSELPVRKVADLEDLYNRWLGASDSPKVLQELHTTFEAVTYNPNPLGIKW